MSYTNPILELEKQKLLLQKEYEAEREAFRHQTEARGMGRLLKRGDAWWPLSVGKAYYNSLNQYCVEVPTTISSIAGPSVSSRRSSQQQACRR